MKKPETKKEAKKSPPPEKKPGEGSLVRVPLISSLWDDEGRRVLLILLVFSFLCILAAILANLFYRPSYKMGEFGGFSNMQENYQRIIIPVGFILALTSLLLFSISGSYGHYTEVTFGKKSVGARAFFRKLSFYSAMLSALFLLSGGIVDSIITKF